MENSYDCGGYYGKRRKLERGREVESARKSAINSTQSGIMGFIARVLAPVTNFFSSKKADTVDSGYGIYTPSTSSETRDRSAVIQQIYNCSSSAADSTRHGQLEGNTDLAVNDSCDDVLVINNETSASSESSKTEELGVVGWKELSRQNVVNGTLGKNFERTFEEESDHSSSSGSTSSKLVIIEAFRRIGKEKSEQSMRFSSDDNRANEKSSKSPSLEPGSSISCRVSPVMFSEGVKNKDRWRRERLDLPSFSYKGMRASYRFTPYERMPDFSINLDNSKHLNRTSGVINAEAKEKYKQFLQELGVCLDHGHKGKMMERHSKSHKLDISDLLHRGHAALDSLVSNLALPDLSSDSCLSSCSFSKKLALPKRFDNRKDFTNGNSSTYRDFFRRDRTISTTSEKAHSREGSKSSDSLTVVWDACRDQALRAMFEAEEGMKQLAKYRFEEHEHELKLRHQRVMELRLEKQLIEEARRSEEISLEEQLRKKLTLTGYVFRDRKAKKSDFPKLDDETEDLVARVWDVRLPSNEKFGSLTRRDLLTLRNMDWLNDEVINGYLDLICDRSKIDKSLPRMYAFNTFFYVTLASKGYNSVRRWTRKVDIFAHDILLVPVHLGAHWCLAVIDFGRKTIEYFDSMGGSDSDCLDILSTYLCREMMDKRKENFDLDDWRLIIREDIPQQMNGSDCGMFACKFAEYASRRAEISFSQEHMPYFRRRMVVELCRGRLL